MKNMKMWAVVARNGQVVALFQEQFRADSLVDSLDDGSQMRRVAFSDLVAGKDKTYHFWTLVHGQPGGTPCHGFDADLLATLPIDTLHEVSQLLWETGYEMKLEQGMYDPDEYTEEQARISQRIELVNAELHKRHACDYCHHV